jgi:hypothetical protein
MGFAIARSYVLTPPANTLESSARLIGDAPRLSANV